MATELETTHFLCIKQQMGCNQPNIFLNMDMQM